MGLLEGLSLERAQWSTTMITAMMAARATSAAVMNSERRAGWPLEAGLSGAPALQGEAEPGPWAGAAGPAGSDGRPEGAALAYGYGSGAGAAYWSRSLPGAAYG